LHAALPTWPTEQTVAVRPDWGMRLMPEAMVLNTKKPGERLTVTMEVTNYRSGPSSGKIRPRLPEGWRAEPAAEQLSFSARGETKRVTFTLEPGSAVRPGAYTIPVEAVVDGRSQSLQVQPIHYDHIGTSYWLRPAGLQIGRASCRGRR